MENQLNSSIQNIYLLLLLLNIGVIILIAILFFLKYLAYKLLFEITTILEKKDGFEEIGKKFQLSLNFIQSTDKIIYGVSGAILLVQLFYIINCF